MQARLIVYPPDNAAIARWIEPGECLRVGRGHDCGLAIDEPTISRLHAELRAVGDDWRLRDLGSKNGTFIDGVRIEDATLPSACWLRFGDVHAELGLFPETQARAMREREQTRHAMSAAFTRRIAAGRPPGPLRDVLAGVLELAGCSRGFLLVARNGDFEVHAGCGLDNQAQAGSVAAFAGSVGAVQRALAQRRPLVVNQVEHEPWLAGRASVVDMRLHSVVCVPLLDGERVLGVVYADRREAGEPITVLDLDLLQAFCESAAVWLLAGEAIDAIETAPRWNTIVSTLAREAPA